MFDGSCIPETPAAGASTAKAWIFGAWISGAWVVAVALLAAVSVSPGWRAHAQTRVQTGAHAGAQTGAQTGAHAGAQTGAHAGAQIGANVDAAALVRRAAENELRAQKDTSHPYRYKLRKQDSKGITTKELIETKDGEVARLILIDDKPLSEEQRETELDRLQNYLDHPELQAHRQKREQEDAERGSTMVKMLPDAFLYKYAGEVEATNGPAVRLLFKPNPTFRPLSHEGEVYHGMEGELWIDKAQERMVRFDAHLVQDVDFGWGLVGRLYKGGSILVEDVDVGDHHWEAKHLHLDLTGKILMVKTITFRTTEDASDFHPVPSELTYKDAIRLLQADKESSQLAVR